MEEPRVSEILGLCKAQGLKVREMDSTFYLSRETIIASERKGLARWRKHLFALMSRNAQPATAYFRLPPNRVVELGMQIEI
jgi:KUP system potassium uptake protein